MQAVQFDASLVKDRKARQFVETAGETMFPDLLPEASRKASTGSPADPMGTLDMLALLDDSTGTEQEQQ